MRIWIFGMVVACASVGCSGSVDVSSLGAGGAGGSSNESVAPVGNGSTATSGTGATSGNASAGSGTAAQSGATSGASSGTGTTTSGSASSSSGGGDVCDNQGACFDCVTCAMEGPCEVYVAKCDGNSECVAILDCYETCNSPDCTTECWIPHPAGQADLMQRNICLYCDNCFNDCNASNVGCPED